jgi:rhodanese-related sulfurtransferase
VQNIVNIKNSEDLQHVFDLYDGLIIDIRTIKDYEKGHIENARNVDLMSPNFVDFFTDLDKKTSLLLYCSDGSRSKVAVRILKEMGFDKLYNLTQGIIKWDGSLT